MKKEHASTEETSERSELRQRIHNAEVDVNYAIYYPLMKPYSSLYPKSKNKKDDSEDGEADEAGSKSKSNITEGPKGDVGMWKAVEQAMEDGTLDKLRHSKDAMPAAPPKKAQKAKAKTKVKEDNKKEKAESKSLGDDRPPRRAYAAPADDDSDGGFFE